jgi:Carboxypeptidase regulatory-like domain/TonB-dependent Receptor Plug Domain
MSAARWSPVVLALYLIAPAALSAQFDAGQISGFVRDSQQGALPGATVTIANEATGNKRSTVTNSTGFYVLPDIPVGSYAVTVELSGFKKFVKTGIRLTAASQIAVDAELELGSLEESIIVTAANAFVQTTTAQVARTIETRQIQELTLNGRNPIYIASLKPGVRGGTIGTFDPDSVSNGSFSINGARADEYLVTIDGAVATRTRSSGSMLGAQDVDTVEEVQVLTANYRAEYGRSSAGQIRFVTKSGTQQFHGDGVENYRNAALDANQWQRNRSGDPRLANGPDPYSFNQWGFHLGGPVLVPGGFNADRSKLFFFWGEEWIRRRDTPTSTATVPSAAMRRGDFSELLNPSNPFFGRARTISDPLTGLPFPNNVIPANRISPNGQALLNVYPMPTPGFQQGTSNWIGTQPRHSDLRKDTVKFDYVPTSSQRFSARIGYTPWTFNDPFVNGTDRVQWAWSRPNKLGAASWNSVLSSTLLNEFTFAFNSDGTGTIDLDPDCGARCDRATYGLSYPYLFPGTKLAPGKIPTIRITGLTTLDADAYPGAWAGFVYTWSDNLTKVIGNHTTKVGVVIEHSGQDDNIQFTTASQGATNNQNGEVRFLDAGHPQSTGLAMANALLGNFNDYNEFGAKASTAWVATVFDAYAQDSWKAGSKVTIEAGMRYSLWPQWYSRDGSLASFDPQFYSPGQAQQVDRTSGFIVGGGVPLNGVVLPGAPGVNDGFDRLRHNLPDGLAQTHKNMFQPRLGLVYAITGKTAFRTGLGLFYNRPMINRDTALGGNPPFQVQQTVVNGSIDAPAGATRRDFPLVVTAQDSVFDVPRAWSWNLTVERQLPWATTVEVAYVGRRGIDNQRKLNINQLPAGTLQANPGVNPNALRPYLGYGPIGLAINDGRSQYHGLQIGVERRVVRGFHAGVGYTLSRTKDNSSSLTDVLPNTYDDSGYRGISDLDRTHVLIANWIYELPFMPQRSDLAGRVLGHWQITGVYQYQSGSPFSVRSNDDFAGVGPGSGNQFWNLVGDPAIDPGPFTTSAAWFNPAAFARPAAGTFGVQPRNMLRNPPTWNFDLGIRKGVPISGTQQVQFRAEAFNVLNHPNWDVANSNPNSGSFGQVTRKVGERVIQLAIRYGF